MRFRSSQPALNARDSASPHPRLLRVRDPFANLLVRAKGGVVIDEQEVFAAAEAEE